MSDSGLPLPPLFPAVGSALRAGVIGVETAEVITRELTLAAPRAAVDDLVAAEHALVGQAAGGADIGLPKSPDLIAVQARQWRDHLDPEGIEPRAEKAFKERDFWVSRTATNGLFTFGGRVTVDVGGKLHALFNSILSPRTAPRYRADEEAAVRTAAAAEVSSVDGNEATATAGETDPTGTAVPGDDARAKQSAPRDLRTPGQIRADVFAAMIDSLSRSGDAPTITGAAPTVVVSVTAEVLKNEKGTGTIVGVSEPVPYSAIKQILCDGSTIPAILDSDGALVGLGTENRLFNRAHRMGMIARDGPTCGVEGCDIPATGCEAHHIIEHAEGGPTHTDNGALYCWFHHRMIDTGVFTVTMVDGRPQVTYPEWLQRKPYFQ